MLEPQDVAEVVRQTLKEEFKELQEQLLQTLRAGASRLESLSREVNSPNGDLVLANASATPSPMGQTVGLQLGATQKTINPLASSSYSQSRASLMRNFVPMKTFRVSEYTRWLSEVDEVVDQKLPASRERGDGDSGRGDGGRDGGLARTGRGRVVPDDLLAETAGTDGSLQRAADAWADEQAGPPSAGADQSGGSRDSGDGADPRLLDRGSKSFMGRASAFGHNPTRAEVAMGLSPPKGGNAAPPASPLQQKAADFVRGVWFEVLSMAMIFGSAVQIGLQTDHMARHTQAHPPATFRALDMLFFLFFVLECGLRIFVYRARYFHMWGWAWNVFDLALIFLQLLEEIFLAISSPGSNAELQSGFTSTFLFRLVRMLRAVRVVRVFHIMRMAEELRLLVSCIMHSYKAFCWSVVLIMLMVYVFGVHFTQISLLQRLAVEVTERGSQDLVQWYGSVPRSVLSLFQGLTGGVDWNDLVDPLIQQISPWMGVLFWLYMSFAILCVMNVVTATFVQHAIERSAQVKEVQKVNQASRLFRTLDADSSGAIKFDEIERNLESKEVQDFFRSIDVDLSEARCLFDMLDTDDSGEIEFAEFLSGCMRLQGPAKAIDLVLVMRELKEVLQLVGAK